jgi:hypothetical protein
MQITFGTDYNSMEISGVLEDMAFDGALHWIYLPNDEVSICIQGMLAIIEYYIFSSTVLIFRRGVI